jgi:hypothetical protein
MNDYLPIHNQVPSWVDNDRRWADAILEAEMGIPSKGPQWVQGARDFGLLPKTPERVTPGVPAHVRDPAYRRNFKAGEDDFLPLPTMNARDDDDHVTSSANDPRSPSKLFEDRLAHPDELTTYDPQHGLTGSDHKPATSPKSMFGGSPPML